MIPRLALILALLLPLPLGAAEVTVEPGPGALQRAIAGALPGDVLILAPGLHPGAITLDRSLTLTGMAGVVHCTDKGCGAAHRAKSGDEPGAPSPDRTREALEHCQKALTIDPTSEGANAEAMKIFLAQGRVDAMHRQYRQYRAALEAIGATEGLEIRSLYRELSRAR